MAVRYRLATKKDKGRLLDELSVSDRLQPWYAVGLLNGAPMKAAVAPRRRAPRVRDRLYHGLVPDALR